MLKLLRINEEGSFIDGCRISDVTLADIDLNYKSNINFKMAVDEKSKNKRGLTIFGKHFGNYNQDIHVRVLYNDNQT
jgi:predicted transcriptional regulator